MGLCLIDYHGFLKITKHDLEERGHCRDGSPPMNIQTLVVGFFAAWIFHLWRAHVWKWFLVLFLVPDELILAFQGSSSKAVKNEAFFFILSLLSLQVVSALQILGVSRQFLQRLTCLCHHYKKESTHTIKKRLFTKKKRRNFLAHFDLQTSFCFWENLWE